MPALDTIEGLGDRAADAVVAAAEEGPFLSLDDFRNRTKVTASTIDLMNDLGFSDICPSLISCPYLIFNKKICGVVTGGINLCISIRKTIPDPSFPGKAGKT